MKKRLKKAVYSPIKGTEIYKYNKMTKKELIVHCSAYVEALHALAGVVSKRNKVQGR